MNIHLNLVNLFGKTNTEVFLYFIIYYIVINLIGFFIMFLDKKKAKNGEYRIKEKTLFIVSILLGGIGSYIGMYKFRHKTRHLTFTIGIPICIIINIFFIYLIITDLFFI